MKSVGGLGSIYFYLQVVFLLNIALDPFLVINFVSILVVVSDILLSQLIISCLMCNSHFVVMVVSINIVYC